MPPWGLLAVAFGMMWLALWRSRLRLAGVAMIALGLASPALVRPPDLLVSAEARLIAVRTPAGVFLQQVSGASKFTRDAWLHYWAADTVPCRFRRRGRLPTARSRAARRRACCGRWPTPRARCWCVARRIRTAAARASRDRIGGACARAVPAAMAGAGRSLHRVAIWRHRDLAG